MRAASVILLAVILTTADIARGAAQGTESFTAGLSGWTNNVDPTPWAAATQAVRAVFGSSVLPQNASLEAGAGASGGAFVGDFRAAGVEAIGFSFLAEDVQPSVLKLELTGGTNVFFQDLRPRMSAVGAWNRFLVSLADRDADRWAGAPASELARALTNVVRVAIRVTTSGATTRAFRLDDVFLDRLPFLRPVNETMVMAEALRTGFVYRIETADVMDGAWTNLPSFVATNRTETRAVSSNPASLFLRLRN